MGKDPGKIAGEITDLREEANVLLDELLRRTNPSYMAGGIRHNLATRAGAMVDRGMKLVDRSSTSASRAAASLPEPVQRNPYPFIGGVVALIALIGGLVIQSRRPKPRTLPEKAADRLRESGAAAMEGIDYSRDQLQEAVDRLWLEMGARGIGPQPAAETRKEEGMMKRVLWAALASAMAALGSMLFKRATETAWRTTMHEEPPKK